MFANFLSIVSGDLQNLNAFDLLTIGTLVILEGILSVDNAIVLAILVRGLPKQQQRRALTYGLVGAVVFRVIAIVLASRLMKAGPIQLIGGVYLLFLSMKHMFFFSKEDAHQTTPKVAKHFWRTIIAVELTDIVFSIDSITTAVAMTDKLLIVWIGGVLGLICLRFLSGVFIKLLDKLPKLEDLAYQIVFFVGIKLTLGFFDIHIEHKYFWMIMGLISILGGSIIWRDYYQKKNKIQHHERLLALLESDDIKLDELLALEYIPGPLIGKLREKGFLLLNEAPKKNP